MRKSPIFLSLETLLYCHMKYSVGREAHLDTCCIGVSKKNELRKQRDDCLQWPTTTIKLNYFQYIILIRQDTILNHFRTVATKWVYIKQFYVYLTLLWKLNYHSSSFSQILSNYNFTFKDIEKHFLHHWAWFYCLSFPHFRSYIS